MHETIIETLVLVIYYKGRVGVGDVGGLSGVMKKDSGDRRFVKNLDIM